jgi:ABC-type phosphate/phosphonate transport system substrate-binding protein
MKKANSAMATRKLTRAVLACCATITLASASAAEYRFTPEPVYPPELAGEIYKPLMDYLSKETGETFVLVLPQNYPTYWRDILKADLTDFSYDEAHFADYRITKSRFIPLVRTAESTSYSLLADAQFEGQDAEALIDHSIVSMPAPNLGYALLMQFFPNPIHQPKFLSTATSWRESVQTVFSGEASATIAPTWMITGGGYPNLVTLKKSREFSGPAVLSAPHVPADVQAKVRDALLKLGDETQLADLLMELGISRFVHASADDYSNARSFLEGFYGYEK